MKPPLKPLGILMLDTRFPRIEGDIGNAKSFDYPVIFRRMTGIGSKDAVAAHPDRPRVLAALKENVSRQRDVVRQRIADLCEALEHSDDNVRDELRL